jgi:FMN-dependent NADH-azoreductase
LPSYQTNDRKILTISQKSNSSAQTNFLLWNGDESGGFMARLLHIDSSPRGERSRSRRMTSEFIERWKQTYPDDLVTYRDIGHHPVPHLDETWIAAAYTPPEQRTPELWEAIRISDQLVDELLAADVYVIGVPMYNFSVPSMLKAYIDQIVRIGRTFEFAPEHPDNPYNPLVLGKKMFIITARGSSGYGSGDRYEYLNYQDPYLKTIFGFIGITDINFIHVENDELGGTSLAQSIANARTQVAQLVGK